MEALRLAVVSIFLGTGLVLGTPGPGAAQSQQEVEVVAANHAYLDMHVYAVQAGRIQSLGMVMGLSRATLTVPRQIARSGQVQLLVDPIGGFGSYLTDPLMIGPGSEIDLDIENNLDLSSATVQANASA